MCELVATPVRGMCAYSKDLSGTEPHVPTNVSSIYICA